MSLQPQIIPKGTIAWTIPVHSYISRQVFCPYATIIYAYWRLGQRSVHNTGLLPMPAAPAVRSQPSRDILDAFQTNPYPEVAKGLAEYWMLQRICG